MPTVALIGAELFPIPPIRGGAAELFIEQVASRLQGWRPVVISRADPELPEHEHRGQVEYLPRPFIRVAISVVQTISTRYFPYMTARCSRSLQTVKPDLIHVHNRPLLALYLQKHLGGRIPVILHLHNLYNSLGKRERPPVGTPIPVAGCVACSQFVLDRERTRLGLGAKSHWVVYNGVDPEIFSCRWQQPEKAKFIRQKYRIAEEPTVLFVGKVRESKGVGVLLHAMERVWQRLPQAVLILAGGTEYGQGRTDRPTPFLSPLAATAATGIRTGGTYRFYPSLPDSRNVSGRGYLCGAIPDRRGFGHRLFRGLSQRAAHYRHPQRRYSGNRPPGTQRHFNGTA